jgi:hypothetical protein
VAGDIFGIGKIDFVTGTFATIPGDPAITVWRNEGPGRSSAFSPGAPLRVR